MSKMDKKRARISKKRGKKEETIAEAISVQETQPEFKDELSFPEPIKVPEFVKEKIEFPGQLNDPEAPSGSILEEASAILIEDKLELLAFQMNREEYAIPTSQVKEIIRPAELTVIPGSSPILLGITSLRGVIIPVFCLSKKMAQLQMSGMNDSQPDQRDENEKLKRIIIIHIDQGFFGLMVDGVTDVIKIDEKVVQPPPPLLNQMGQDMIKGITRFKNRLIILLFIARIVDLIQEEIKKIRKT